MRKDAETRGAKRSRSRGTEGQKRKKTRGHGDARTRGAAGHTDLLAEISRVGGDLEPRVLVSASSPLRVSPEGTLRTWAPGHLCTDTSAPGHLGTSAQTPQHLGTWHLCTEHLLTPHPSLSALRVIPSLRLRVRSEGTYAPTGCLTRDLAASMIASASIWAAWRSSSGLPEPGISRTASLTRLSFAPW